MVAHQMKILLLRHKPLPIYTGRGSTEEHTTRSHQANTAVTPGLLPCGHIRFSPLHVLVHCNEHHNPNRNCAPPPAKQRHSEGTQAQEKHTGTLLLSAGHFMCVFQMPGTSPSMTRAELFWFSFYLLFYWLIRERHLTDLLAILLVIITINTVGHWWPLVALC